MFWYEGAELDAAWPLLSQVNKAVEHVQSGTTALVTAKKLQRGKRKCMCFALILLLIIIAIIVLVIIKPWKK